MTHFTHFNLSLGFKSLISVVFSRKFTTFPFILCSFDEKFTQIHHILYDFSSSDIENRKNLCIFAAVHTADNKSVMKVKRSIKEIVNEITNSMNSYLLIGLESLIDHIGCIRDLGIAYWKKSNKKMQIGDIVYLFISDIEHNRVMYRLEVVDTDCVRDDKKYWRSTYKHDISCFKLKNISGVYCGDGLGHEDLEKHGISRYVQYKKLNEKQANWLEKHFI